MNEKGITLQDVVDFIRRETFSAAGRKEIIDAYNYNIRRTQAIASTRFYPGDRVTWDSKYGPRVTGTVRKVNRMTVICIADKTGTTWRVSPGLLQKA